MSKTNQPQSYLVVTSIQSKLHHNVRIIYLILLESKECILLQFIEWKVAVYHFGIKFSNEMRMKQAKQKIIKINSCSCTWETSLGFFFTQSE